MRKLTLKTLIAKGACKDQVELFKAAFGGRVDVTVALCVKHAGQFDWSWAARNLLSEAGRTDYDRARAPAWADYERAIVEASADYDSATVEASIVYHRATAPAWAEYNRAMAVARAGYNRARAPAWADYDRARAVAFATLYIQEVMTDA
jgi:hypothetical protein